LIGELKCGEGLSEDLSRESEGIGWSVDGVGGGYVEVGSNPWRIVDPEMSPSHIDGLLTESVAELTQL